MHLLSIVYKPTLYNEFGVGLVPMAVRTTVLQ